MRMCTFIGLCFCLLLLAVRCLRSDSPKLHAEFQCSCFIAVIGRMCVVDTMLLAGDACAMMCKIERPERGSNTNDYTTRVETEERSAISVAFSDIAKKNRSSDLEFVRAVQFWH